jgi:hypothetical protein
MAVNGYTISGNRRGQYASDRRDRCAPIVRCIVVLDSSPLCIA